MLWKYLAIGAGLLLTCAPRAGAQLAPPWSNLEVRMAGGAWVPTGAMRDDFRDAGTIGVQGAAELSDNLHAILSASWTRGHARQMAGTSLTYVWQYDVGVESNLRRPLAAGWAVNPFLGVGAGLRTYDYRASGDLRSCTAAYGAVGAELQRQALALRVEVRDYVSCYESPLTGSRKTRNDVGIMAGIAWHLR